MGNGKIKKITLPFFREKKCDGLITLRRLARHHPDCLIDFHTVSDLVLIEVC